MRREQMQRTGWWKLIETRSGVRCVGLGMLILAGGWLCVLSPLRVPVAVAAAQAPNVVEEQRRLVAVLGSDVSYMERLSACKRLASIGTAEAVPTLIPLLADRQLAFGARLALEAIPDPAAAAALREAAARLDGPRLVGVLHSLGARRDREAEPLLIRRLADKDPRVVAAAGWALGRLGSATAARALLAVLPQVDAAARAAVGDGCLQCAERVWQAGRPESAVAIYDQLCAAPPTRSIGLAATRGALLARPAELRSALLAEQLGAADDDRFGVALGVARELDGAAVTAALLDQLARAEPARQPRLIAVLGDRGDVAARPAVIELCASAELPVRVAAIRALSTLGDLSTVRLLVEQAQQPESLVAAQAVASLTALRGADIDRTILAMLTDQTSARGVLIEVAGRRGIAAAVPQLLEAARDGGALRLAAITALGSTIDADRLEQLTVWLEPTANEAERAAARESLQLACARLADEAGCARKLVACLPGLPSDGRVTVLELLGTVGGPLALKTVTGCAFDPDVAIQDAATRVLGQWKTADVATRLLEIVDRCDAEKFRIRALRGYIRVIRQFDVVDVEKLAMVRRALAVAWRTDEKRLAVEALGRIATAESLTLALQQLAEPDLREAACGAIVEIAPALRGQQPAAVRDALQRVLQTTANAQTRQAAQDMVDRPGSHAAPGGE